MSARRRQPRVAIGSVASTFNALGVLNVLAEVGVVLTLRNGVELLRLSPNVSRSLARLFGAAADVAELPSDEPMPNVVATAPTMIARQRFEECSTAMGDAVGTMLTTARVGDRGMTVHKAALEHVRDVHAEWQRVHRAYHRTKPAAGNPGEET